MDLIAPAVAHYIQSMVPERPAELQRMEAIAKETDFPIIGPAAGWFCYQLARLLKARSVFELGSGFGYSTAWFARAVRENGGGVVHHVVWNDDLSRRAREHLDALGLSDLVHFTIGEAVETLRAQTGPFDLIFNDIDKEGYPAALDVIRARLKPGGLLITDNALWHGDIFDPADTTPATEGVREFTRRLRVSDQWLTSIVPIRDGLLVALKTA